MRSKRSGSSIRVIDFAILPCRGFLPPSTTSPRNRLGPVSVLRIEPDVRWLYGLKDRPRYAAGLTEAQIYAQLELVSFLLSLHDTSPRGEDASGTVR